MLGFHWLVPLAENAVGCAVNVSLFVRITFCALCSDQPRTKLTFTARQRLKLAVHISLLNSIPIDIPMNL
jgi:hypothetical protein